MQSGWTYRLAGLAGVVALTVLAILVANHHAAQWLFTSYVPVFDRLHVNVLTGASFRWALLLSVIVVSTSLYPLYKPRPRRILDTVTLVQRRLIWAGLVLATLGFFEWSYRLPRATLVILIGTLAITVPFWFLLIRRRPAESDARTILVGDDVEQIDIVADAIDGPVLGYLCPSAPSPGLATGTGPTVTDGGVVSGERTEMPADERSVLSFDETEHGGGTTHDRSLPRLGGLARIHDVLVDYDVDVAVLTFRRADRAEFFGTLDACYQHGVSAKVHRRYADTVLVAPGAVDELVDVDLEPWDPQDYAFKRAFDVLFAAIGLVAFAPVMAIVALAVRLDSDGPVLYSQERTTEFGETFRVYKFRTMSPMSGSPAPIEDEMNPAITRVGRVLRPIHLDELPQLWSILRGRMSVVGPRAAWTDEEALLEVDAPEWRKRWFVKPGLTGLAQIYDVRSTEPNQKLRYDLEYIRRQSFWFDVKIVIRQLWLVLGDVRRTIGA